VHGKRVIEVVDYDPHWALAFDDESRALTAVFGEEVVSIHHIGSTAVPGLKAKPVIDILFEVRDVEVLDAYDAAMVNLRYTPRGEFGIPGRRFYLKGLHDRTHHVHAFTHGSADVVRHLAFRDYLIAHPGVAAEYAALKTRVAAACNNNSDRYCDGKHDFVRCHETLALAWVQPGAMD
jgi:GrpB-like predicted nucleotidyltransferase (UPF0157 family)